MIVESKYSHGYYSRYLYVVYQIYVSKQNYIRQADVNIRLEDKKLIEYLYLVGRL
mgnify:CR=1 FL=1